MRRLTEHPTPVQIKEFAQKLLDTEAFTVLLSLRIEEVTDDILLTDGEKEVLKAKAEYVSLQSLIQWIEQRAERGQYGRR